MQTSSGQSGLVTQVTLWFSTKYVRGVVPIDPVRFRTNRDESRKTPIFPQTHARSVIMRPNVVRGHSAKAEDPSSSVVAPPAVLPYDVPAGSAANYCWCPHKTGCGTLGRKSDTVM